MVKDEVWVIKTLYKQGRLKNIWLMDFVCFFLKSDT